MKALLTSTRIPFIMGKTSVLILLIISTFSQASAQTVKPPLDISTIEKAIYGIDTTNEHYLIQNSPHYRLASRYTFRNLVKNDFSTVTIADNTATVGQFAALSIDPNTYKLAFSPYAWSPQGKALAMNDFKDVFAFNVTATLSNQSLLNLKDWRTVTGSFSYTHILGEGYKYAKSTAKNDTEYLKPYVLIYDNLAAQLRVLYHKTYRPDKSTIDELNALNHPEFSDIDDLKQSYLDSISRYEQLKTKSEWKMKDFWWFKITANALSFDNANYVVLGDPSTFDTPKKSTQYTGSINASINYFEGFSNHWNFYLNLDAQVGLKDMFTGIYTPTTYNGFSKLTDTSLIQKTNEQVFETTSENVSTKVLPDFSSEIIMLHTFSKAGVALGADIVYSYSFVISNKAGYSTGYISSPSIGVIFGLHDKTGKSNINIEPYFQYQDYRKVTVSSQHLFGIKFSIPINSLY